MQPACHFYKQLFIKNFSEPLQDRVAPEHLFPGTENVIAAKNAG
jgi:hypothetical protein